MTRIGHFVLASFAVLYFWNLGIPELTTVDESRSGTLVRDMVEGGNWLLPRTPDGYLTEKPVAFYLACVGITSVGGMNEVSMRTVSVLMALGTLLITGLLAASYGSTRTSWLAMLALGSNIIFMRWARMAMVDMMLTFFLTAGLASYFMARRGRWSAAKASIVTGVAFGIAVLTKGPLGLALPLAVIAGDIALSTRGRIWKAPIPWRHVVSAACIIVALTLTWYLPGFLKGGREFLHTSFLDENFYMPMGLSHGIAGSHVKSRLYYVGRQLAAFLPLTILLIPSMKWIFARNSGEARNHLAVWFVAGFLLFSAASNKRAYYLLPLQPALAILIALGVEKCLESAKSTGLQRSAFFGGAILMVLGIFGMIAALKPSCVHERFPDLNWLDHSPVAAGLSALLILLALFLIIVQGNSARALQGAIACALLVVVVRVALVDPAQTAFDRMKPFAREMRARIPPGATVAAHPSLYGYGLDFYWPHRLPRDAESVRNAEFVFIRRERTGDFEGATEEVGSATFKWDDRTITLLRRVRNRN